MNSTAAGGKSNDNSNCANSDSPFSVQFATPNDVKAICDLFKKVFQHEMTPEHWHWKYDRDLSRSILVYRDKQLVAHYGGVGTEVLLAGEKSTAIQVTDLMVDQQARNTVRSASPFFLSAKKFLESFVGYKNPFLLAYGFPSERAMGLSEKLDLFAPVGTMWETQWTVSAGEKSFPEEVIELDKNNFSKYENKIDLLWKKFGKNFSSNYICCKDAAYFRWRYLEHPSKQYSLYLVLSRFTKAPKALLVLKHEKNISMLMDLLSTSLNLEKLIELALKIASHKESRHLVTWCSDCYTNRFSLLSAEQKSLPIIIPANTGSQGPAPETQINKWWFMPGDTDYL